MYIDTIRRAAGRHVDVLQEPSRGSEELSADESRLGKSETNIPSTTATQRLD